MTCGMRLPTAHDHEEVDLGVAASVTDRGIRHRRNEDACFLALPTPGTAVAIVADGVSSTDDADHAALAAVAAAGPLLVGAVENGADLDAALLAAHAAAQHAVAALATGSTLTAPSCTFTATVVVEGRLWALSVGDSRAYWIVPSAPERLTVDDSWAEDQVRAGRLSRAEAEAAPEGHTITRWLGADAPPGAPEVVTRPVGDGLLLVCSDGLWNEWSEPAALAALVAAAPDPTPLALARHLVDAANAAGGHDNITVVLVRLPATPAPEEGP